MNVTLKKGSLLPAPDAVNAARLLVGAQRGELWSFRPHLIGDMAQHCTRHSAIALKRSRFAGKRPRD
jgi:hypothetical protein